VCVFNRGACVVRPWKESATHHRARVALHVIRDVDDHDERANASPCTIAE
jgi:hypothetical protein